MIDGMVAGTLVGDAEMREGRHASQFVLAKVRANTADGDAIVVNVIAFAPDLCTTLMALRDGDPVALTGSLTPKVWTDKQGNTKPVMDMVASKVLSAHPIEFGRPSEPLADN